LRKGVKPFLYFRGNAVKWKLMGSYFEELLKEIDSLQKLNKELKKDALFLF